jgi:hypothetical protein
MKRVLKGDDEGGAFCGDANWPKTRWSLLEIIRVTDGPEKIAALNTLILAYGRPVYAHLRSHNYNDVDAAEFTQSFFYEWFLKDKFVLADREKGS